MMKRIVMSAVAVASMFVLNACGPSCADACKNVPVACKAEFDAAKITFDVAKCTKDCDANTEKCTNVAAQKKCVADAKACKDILACPSCTK